jgi:hypothetical protein
MFALMGNVSPDTDSVLRVVNRVDTINQIEIVHVEESYVKSRKLPQGAYSASLDSSRNLALVCFSSHENVTDPKVMEKEVRIHHPYASVRRIAAEDFIASAWSRGTGLAIRPGTSELFANGCKHAEYPYYPDRRVAVVGSDVSQVWGGFMEGAVISGRSAAAKMREYLTPNPKEYNDNKQAPKEAWSMSS